MQARSPSLEPARDDDRSGSDRAADRTSDQDRRSVDVLDALLVMLLVAPFFLA